MSKIKEYSKYPLRTCRTLHRCDVCEQDITCGQSYYDGGYGRRCHKLCAGSVMENKNIRITEKVSLPMHGYCHSCDFSTVLNEEFTAAELHLFVRLHVENTGHQAVLHGGIKVTFYSLAK